MSGSGSTMSNDWCDGCRRRWNKNPAPMAPMLHDAAWSKIAAENEMLCGACFFKPLKERDVFLSLADLLPCPFNLFHWPHSWFNLFAGKESPPTVVDDEWRSAWLSGGGWRRPKRRRLRLGRRVMNKGQVRHCKFHPSSRWVSPGYPIGKDYRLRVIVIIGKYAYGTRSAIPPPERPETSLESPSACAFCAP